MLVDDVMTHAPNMIDASGTLASAADRMRALVVGVLPVVAAGRLIGVVTDRDLVVRGIARGLDPEDTTVAAIMTEHPITCRPESRVALAAALMLQYRLRRIIVVDETDYPVGVISLEDLAGCPETRHLAAEVLSRIQTARALEIDGVLGQPMV